MPGLPAVPNGGQWARVGPVCAAEPGGRGRGKEPTHAVGRDCSEKKLATRTSPESSLPVAAGTLGAVNGTAHGGDTASLTSKPILVNAAHTPSDSASGAFASLAWIGSDAASRKAARQRAAGCNMCRLQRDRSPVALGCNIVHVVATRCAALMRHTCVAQRQMSRRAAGLAQRSAGDGFGCGADVGKGWTRSQCKGGQGIDSVKLRMWVGE